MTKNTIKVQNTNRQSVSVINHRAQPIKLTNNLTTKPIGYAYITESDIDEITKSFNE